MCWDPGKHAGEPLPHTLYCASSSCPFCLFLGLLPVTLACCLCDDCCLILSSHMTRSFFLLSSVISIFPCQPITMLQELQPWPVGSLPQDPAGLLFGAIKWQHWACADRQTVKELACLLGTGWKTESTMSVHLPHHLSYRTSLVRARWPLLSLQGTGELETSVWLGCASC